MWANLKLYWCKKIMTQNRLCKQKIGFAGGGVLTQGLIPEYLYVSKDQNSFVRSWLCWYSSSSNKPNLHYA